MKRIALLFLILATTTASARKIKNPEAETCYLGRLCLSGFFWQSEPGDLRAGSDWVNGKFTNRSQETLGDVVLEFEIYDENAATLGTTTVNLESLRPGSGATFRVPIYAANFAAKAVLKRINATVEHHGTPVRGSEFVKFPPAWNLNKARLSSLR